MKNEDNSKIKALATTIKDKGEDAYYFMHRATNKIDSVKNTIHVLKTGYSYSDTWNFGYWLIERTANIVGYLKEQDYNDPPQDWIENLEMCEKVFRSYNTYINPLLPICLYRVNDNPDLKKAWETGDEAANTLFLKWWMWYGKNIFTNDNFPRPIVKKENALTKTRKRAKQKISSSDIHNLAHKESKMMEEMLHKWAFEGISYSENYYNSNKELSKKYESWENNHLPMHLDYELTSRNKTIKHATPKELGLDYAAWKCDIYSAASVFQDYAEWLGPIDGEDDTDNYMSQKDAMELLMPTETKVFKREINKEVLKCWEWIGKNLAGMWD